ncbi:MAG: maleylacetoacetate isomerase [Panacagrimonas sp.]
MKLYNYFRSSASYRVRIALELKNLSYDYMPVHLLREGGEQFGAAFADINPAHLVPVLEDGGDYLAQSMAIMEYLDEQHPEPPLLPRSGAADRARVRQICLAIACDIHPLNNLRVLKYLKDPLALSEEQKDQWARHWIGLGFAALERQLARSGQTGAFCFGDAPTLADCFLVPQMFNAQRFGTDLQPYPTLRRIEAHCAAHAAFVRAHPLQQVHQD